MSKKSHFELVKYEPHKINFEELIFIFTLASILGFIVETIYIYLVCGNIVKRGVLIGPYCPIYGFGAIILYLSFFEVRREKQNIPLIFIISSLLMGSFELMCGLGFKYFLNIEMWNYAGKFLNILNYTTVPILISWGILGTIYVFFVHPLIIRIVSLFPKRIMKRISLIIVCILICDIMISTRRIFLSPKILEDLVHPENIEKTI